MSHALLNPSACARWFECTPSPRLEANFPETTSEPAEEGTLAHAFGEAILNQHWNPQTSKEYKGILKELRAGNLPGYVTGYFKKYYTPAMFEYATGYAALVLSLLPPDGILFVERKIKMDQYVPHGFGTMDAGIMIPSQRKFIFVDLKYGKGVQVFAERNKQLMDYAVGVVQEYGFMCDIDTIEMHIYQPRKDHHDVWSIGTDELMDWAENELKPRALLAWEGKGELKAGDHCKFCKAKAKCKAFETMMEEISSFEFRSPHLLTDYEVLKLIPKIRILEDWMLSISEYMYAQALGGKNWDGYKLVEGHSRRSITDEELAADKLMAEGYPSNRIWRRSLVTLGDLEALVGAKNLADILGPILHKPAGDLVLVPESAKGERISSAAKVFADADRKVANKNSNLDFLL